MRTILLSIGGLIGFLASAIAIYEYITKEPEKQIDGIISAVDQTISQHFEDIDEKLKILLKEQFDDLVSVR